SSKGDYSYDHKKNVVKDLPIKCLLQIPSRFAIEMVNRGWILRNTIIWHKPNCMPSSAKDRFTVDFEYVYFFTKSKKYYFEQQFEDYGTGQTSYRDRDMRPNEQGRNKRTVWTINTKPFKEAHFAVFPEELVETPIKAGCPKYICKKCGKARMKIIDNSERVNTRPGLDTGSMKSGKDIDPNKELHKSDLSKYRQQIKYKEIGYTDCGCGKGFKPGIDLDPFMGAGTVGIVAKKLGRNYIGIELNPEYCKIAEARIKAIPNTLFKGEEK
ncbi:MAG: site-specific DNA-methyltransferase, partial [Actinomycetota bacterium]|nr:site-specific DNA-methyltransferase [Actinomycetota bacterium]